MKRAFTTIPILFTLTLTAAATTHADDSLIAHWPLATDGRDISGNNLHATAHDIDFTAIGPSKLIPTAANFNGRSSRLEVPDHEFLHLGEDDFTIAAWVYTDESTDDIPGDILSKYDLHARRGFHLALKTNAGVTFSQPNFRQLQFGIDDNRAADEWSDCGRPGNALLAFALCSYHGDLYAGSCEPGRNEAGHVYRYAGDQNWIDCGSPDKSNAVTALAEFDGHLYAGTGKYRVAGSSLPESENMHLGGRVFRYDPPSGWIDCSGPRGTDFSGTDFSPSAPEAIGGLAVFQGKLYATSLYQPPGFFRYDGKQTWTECELPTRPADVPGESKHLRVEALAPFNGFLYATTYDGGRVFRFDGNRWADCGQLAENTQTYSLAVYNGELYVGTWPSGRVYRPQNSPATAREGEAPAAEPNPGTQAAQQKHPPIQWQDRGRLGEELEVMGMLVHNGRLIAGTLPLAEVYQYNGDNTWQKLARLDHSPDVRYRRAWCMAEHAGQVFSSTLPSGKVYSWRAGRIAMANQALMPGWHHVAATRTGGSLKIFLDAQQVAEETGFQPTDFDVSNEKPLQIGLGPNDYFRGRLHDVRLYRRALTADEILPLVKK